MSKFQKCFCFAYAFEVSDSLGIVNVRYIFINILYFIIYFVTFSELYGIKCLTTKQRIPRNEL